MTDSEVPRFPYHTQLPLRVEQINDTLIHLRSNVLPYTAFPSFSWVYTFAIFFHRLKQKASMKIKKTINADNHQHHLPKQTGSGVISRSSWVIYTEKSTFSLSYIYHRSLLKICYMANY